MLVLPYVKYRPWHQFRELLPEGRIGLIELVAELKEFVKDGDHEAVRKTVDQLDKLIGANLSAPDFQAP